VETPSLDAAASPSLRHCGYQKYVDNGFKMAAVLHSEFSKFEIFIILPLFQSE